MPEKLTLPTVELLEVSRKTGKLGVAKFKSTLPAAVIKKMGWAEMPECFSGGALVGELAATIVELTPKDDAAAKHAMELGTTKISKFTAVHRELEGKRAQGQRVELRFEVSFSDEKGLQKLGAYQLSAGKSEMTVSYTPAAKQETLPGTEEKDTGCVACNNEIPLQDDNPKKHVTGAKCTRKATQEPLPE